MRADPSQNPFIDPDGHKAYVTEREQAFRTEWVKQQKTPPNLPQ